jgi:hypothetical protein
MEAIVSHSPIQWATTGFTLLLCASIAVGTSRLFLSPIRHIPGPKLAALTRWYEFYFEVVLKGQYTFHIQELHKRYGPIVRVTPDEVHVCLGRSVKHAATDLTRSKTLTSSKSCSSDPGNSTNRNISAIASAQTMLFSRHPAMSITSYAEELWCHSSHNGASATSNLSFRRNWNF